MAQYRLSVQMIGRGQGRSATAAAAYRSASRIYDHETNTMHDYTGKRGVLHTEIRAPEDTPDWMQDRAQLWNAVHAVEKRKNSQFAREIQLNLPHELDLDQQKQLVQRFVDEQCISRGMIADIAIHAPSSHELADSRNVHAHIMTTTREFFGNEWAKNKNRDWHKTEMIENWREAWADVQNREFDRLRKAGVRGLDDVRVDHRSLVDQGVEREPQIHLGPTATKMERAGKRSERGRENDVIKNDNTLVVELDDWRHELDKKIVFEKRKFAVWEEKQIGQLRIDEQKHRAQYQVGLAGRKLELERALEKEFGSDRGKLSRQHDFYSERLAGRGWRKWLRDITLTTSRDKKILARLEEEQKILRASENIKRYDFEQQEAKRRAAITEEMRLAEEDRRDKIAKARAKREANNWKPKPPPAFEDHKKVAAKPLIQKFNEAAKEPQKPHERSEGGWGVLNAPDKSIHAHAAVIRQEHKLHDPYDHIGRAIAKHKENPEQTGKQTPEMTLEEYKQKQREARKRIKTRNPRRDPER